jgi:hypothetical protein
MNSVWPFLIFVIVPALFCCYVLTPANLPGMMGPVSLAGIPTDVSQQRGVYENRWQETAFYLFDDRDAIGVREQAGDHSGVLRVA